ncbi:addiction module component family protein [Stigmatella aurantiaca DW4/3-1]|uniref:Addiction module component family protein n=2 Tax=Stigmatella aurantiaca TaxID=41 RepID=Q090R9_STIAD|nr:addiction module component family protein [Stigmatella aurantiaca DW4/3-1]EAU66201.1 putative addiction module component, family [Stigmatella aurantiaca DW4/3-1]
MGQGLNFCPMATKEDLLSDVLRLPPEERAEVAHKLLLSLEAETEDPEAQAEWSAELERRAREVLDGSVQTVLLEQVEERIRARLDQRR